MNQANKLGRAVLTLAPGQDQPVGIKGCAVEDTVLKIGGGDGVEVASVGKGMVPECDQWR
jgi:hypothetical protein